MSQMQISYFWRNILNLPTTIKVILVTKLNIFSNCVMPTIMWYFRLNPCQFLKKCMNSCWNNYNYKKLLYDNNMIINIICLLCSFSILNTLKYRNSLLRVFKGPSDNNYIYIHVFSENWYILRFFTNIVHCV